MHNSNYNLQTDACDILLFQTMDTALKIADAVANIKEPKLSVITDLEQLGELSGKKIQYFVLDLTTNSFSPEDHFEENSDYYSNILGVFMATHRIHDDSACAIITNFNISELEGWDVHFVSPLKEQMRLVNAFIQTTVNMRSVTIEHKWQMISSALGFNTIVEFRK